MQSSVHFWRGSRRSLQAGVAIIETALVLPFFLLLTFLLINFGVGLYNQAVLTNASREAARKGVVFRVPAPTYDDIRDTALAYCQNHLVTFGADATPQVEIDEPGGRMPGEPLQVTVRYAYQGIQVLDAISPGGLAATTTMIYE